MRTRTDLVDLLAGMGHIHPAAEADKAFDRDAARERFYALTDELGAWPTDPDDARRVNTLRAEYLGTLEGRTCQ